jgi:ketosteroid isomerase-like protein
MRAAALAAFAALIAAATPSQAAQPGQPAARPDLCSPAQYAQLAADAQAICDHGRRWIERFKAGDIDGLMALYDKDAQVALHDQPKLTGAAAIREFFAPSLAARPEVSFELHVEDIQVYAEVAVLVSRYWYTSTARRGERYQDAGRSLLVYKRVPGATGVDQWKILVDIDNNTPDVTFPKP